MEVPSAAAVEAEGAEEEEEEGPLMCRLERGVDRVEEIKEA